MNAMVSSILAYSFMMMLTMPLLVSTSAVHCMTSSPGNLWLSIPVTVHFLGDVLNNLTSEPARLPLVPYQLKTHV